MTATFGDLGAGATLGRYELLLPIAQGGMAQVWAARLKGTRGFSKTVAVKMMLPSLSDDPSFEKMFQSEAEIASRIKHPNVCEILDLGEQDRILYLVMEWIEGESLVTLAGDCQRQERRLPFEVAARLIGEAARGLHAAHELKDEEGELVGVVHRDVSPQNILVTYEGHAKIVDFGVAKVVARGGAQQTSTGHLKGKAQFMAPEQAYCDDVDRRTDVFALGIVLYQLTTGAHPFRADNDLATLARITSPDPVPGPETLVPDYPPELARVAKKALAKSADDRYATMGELAADIEGVTAKLVAEGHDVSAETFVRELLAPRANERMQALRRAVRVADERSGARAVSMTGLAAVPRDDAGTGAPVSMERRGRGKSLTVAVGLVGIAIGLAAASAIWGTRSPPPAGVAATLKAETPTAAAPPPSTTPKVVAGPVPAATTLASAVPEASATAASASKPALPAPQAVPVATPRVGKPIDKFRNPGF